MNLNEYFNMLNSMKSLVPESAVSQMKNVNASLVAYNAVSQVKNINASLAAYDSIKPAIEQMNIIRNMVNPQFLKTFNSQQAILEKLRSLNIDLNENFISEDSSIKLSEVSTQIVEEIYDEDNELSEQTMHFTETISDMSDRKFLTWDKALSLILAVLSLISFFQSQLPDKQMTNIENLLEQSVQLQLKEIELLEKASE